jgi:hypothetical protein
MAIPTEVSRSCVEVSLKGNITLAGGNGTSEYFYESQPSQEFQRTVDETRPRESRSKIETGLAWERNHELLSQLWIEWYIKPLATTESSHLFLFHSCAISFPRL